ncbi:MAG: bifunctional demethylmenaquinone methyltransferase/2-methoxy-6-polyprenyl-1,4-benzoquinol methylase UbiE [Pseudomonadota bacterium]
MTQATTDFGYTQVPLEEKAERVRAVFDSVADRYDLMNDLMSCGIHRLWKRAAIELTGIRPGHRVLDLAGGTGDLTSRLVGQVGPKGEVVLSDINASMLARGRDRLIDEGHLGIEYVQANAECLPFQNNSFDRVTMAFGLRNVTRKETALSDIFRVLKPGGRLVVLEFSHPVLAPFARLYDFYSFTILPRLGGWVTGDSASYRYLAESIRKHPDQETLKTLFEAAGFERCDYLNLTGGTVAIHRGVKL